MFRVTPLFQQIHGGIVWCVFPCCFLSVCQFVGQPVHHFGPENISVINGWITMKYCTCILGAQRMIPYGYVDPLTFTLVPQATHICHLFSEIYNLLDGLALNLVYTFMLLRG